jgi:hypothetical protein
MAKHDVNLGVNKTLGAAAFIFSALAVGVIDARFGISDAAHYRNHRRHYRLGHRP